MTINLSLHTRFFLMGALQAHRDESEDGLRIARDVFAKVAIPKEEFSRYSMPNPNGPGFVLNEAELAEAPAIDVDLEKSEARKLKAVVDKVPWTAFSIDDLPWLDALKAQLTGLQ